MKLLVRKTLIYNNKFINILKKRNTISQEVLRLNGTWQLCNECNGKATNVEVESLKMQRCLMFKTFTCKRTHKHKK